MAGASVIDDYVAALRGRLRGDAKAMADLLTEARDSLDDAAHRYREAGFADEEAQRRAVADFGPVGLIARGYQSELAVAYGARTLRSMLFVLPVVQLMWEGTRLLWVGPWENMGAAPPSWYYPFAWVNDCMVWAVAVAVAAALLVNRWMGRRSFDNRIIARCSAGVAVAAITASLLATSALVVATAVFDVQRLLVYPFCSIAALVSFFVMGRLAVMARRTAVFCPA